jgi:hypothetical protein
MAVPISTLAVNVQSRVEELPTGPPGIFWSYQFEILTAIVEAMNDLMVLVGRPLQTVNVPYTLTPNTVWQSYPTGVFLITDMWGANGVIHKVDLNSMDFVMSSWSPSWENDTSDTGPVRWMPIGMTMFAVHPAPSVPMTVNIDAIQYPVAEAWPYTGTETVPFQDEFHEAIEEYAAHFCRLKESGQDFQQSLSLYQQYLAVAKRMSDIQDRRDPVIFSTSLGAAAGVRQIDKT